MAVKTFAAISIGSAVTEMKIFEYTSRKSMKEIDWVATRLNLGLDAYSNRPDQQQKRGGTLRSPA